MGVVREPRTDNADPFGDFPASKPSPTPSPIATLPDSPPPTSDDFRFPEDESTSGPPGGVVGGFLAAGVARLIGIGVVIAVSTSGFGLFVRSVGHEGAPNVPAYVLEACSEAKLLDDPLNLWTGTPIAYDQSGSDARVTFEATSDVTWSCMYTPSTGTAVVNGLDETLGS